MTFVLVSGAVAVGLALMENHAAKSGDVSKADNISLVGNVLLLGGAITLSLYLFSGMPLLHWF